MATHTQVTPDVEPTPEFDALCMALVRDWQHGHMPSEQVVQGLKELTKDASTSGHIANEGRAEHLSGYMQHYMGNWNISNMHYQRARQLFERVGNRKRISVMDLNQGENYRYQGMFKRARKFYHQAYEGAITIKDIRLQTMATTNEGLIYVSLKQYEHAEKALRHGWELTKQWEDDSNLEALLTEIHYGLAQCALANKAHNLAWEHANLSLSHARAGGIGHSVGLAFRVLGDALTQLDKAPEDSDFDTPEACYGAALDTFGEIGAPAEIARTKYSHALSYANRRRRRHAAQLFREAMEIFTRLGMTDDAASAAEAQLRVI